MLKKVRLGIEEIEEAGKKVARVKVEYRRKGVSRTRSRKARARVSRGSKSALARHFAARNPGQAQPLRAVIRRRFI